MWITGVWNPLFEFPDLLQVFQEKVRYYITWGYTSKLLAFGPAIFLSRVWIPTDQNILKTMKKSKSN